MLPNIYSSKIIVQKKTNIKENIKHRTDHNSLLWSHKHNKRIQTLLRLDLKLTSPKANCIIHAKNVRRNLILILGLLKRVKSLFMCYFWSLAPQRTHSALRISLGVNRSPVGDSSSLTNAPDDSTWSASNTNRTLWLTGRPRLPTFRSTP